MRGQTTMTDSDPNAPDPVLPQARLAAPRRSRISPVWLVPIIAALLGAWLAWKAISETGPAFAISFKTAEGLEAGKTKIKYRDVNVGVVESIAVAPDRSSVIVHARMEKFAEDYLVENTRFWVVRPRVAGGNVQGLGTLLSGSYIGMDIGDAGEERREFVGLEEQPVISTHDPGRSFMLKDDRLGSYGVGSPVYFRKFPVGQVESAELDKDGRAATVRVFIRAPYDQYVNAHTRFWESSGIDLKFDAAGVSIDTESLASILIGGISFQTRGDAVLAEPAPDGSGFRLFKTREAALAYEEVYTLRVAMPFRESVRGLAIGAPVDFRGVVIGEVTDIRPQWDEQDNAFDMIALVNLYPDRFARRRIGALPSEKLGLSRQEGIDVLVKEGLRGQLRTGNLLTGQLYIALDFFRDARPQKVAWSDDPPRFPTRLGSLTAIDQTVAEIAKKLAKVPFDDIGRDLKTALETLDRTLKSVDALAVSLNRDVAPEARESLIALRKSLVTLERTVAQDAPLQQDMRETLREVSRAAASLRALTDYLEQHPEALIRGRPEDKP
jgi:paraquat-inducible protein B